MKKLLLSLIALVAMAACTSTDEPDYGSFNTIALTAEQQSALDCQSGFVCNFFKETVKQSAEANVVVSPLSMSMDLAMLANGAAGETRAELLTQLGAADGSLDNLNSMNRVLMSSLPTVDRNTNLSLANAIWVMPGVSVLPSFTDVCAANFGATVRNLPANPEEAKNEINRWAEEKTNGLIRNFMTQPPVMMQLALTNALYFKSPWTHKFDKSKTSKKIFHGVNSNVKIEFMEDGKVSCSTGGVNAGDVYMNVTSLPFGNGNYSISFVEPSENLDKAIAQLTPATISNILAVSKSGAHDEWLAIPKMKIESKQNELAKVLKEMGMTHLFEDCNLSKLLAKPATVGNVSQSSVFELDEQGGKGASVSKVEIGYTSAGPNGPTCHNIDRPFLFLISERSTGAVLFMGKVAQL